MSQKVGLQLKRDDISEVFNTFVFLDLGYSDIISCSSIPIMLNLFAVP